MSGALVSRVTTSRGIRPSKCAPSVILADRITRSIRPSKRAPSVTLAFG